MSCHEVLRPLLLFIGLPPLCLPAQQLKFFNVGDRVGFVDNSITSTDLPGRPKEGSLPCYLGMMKGEWDEERLVLATY